jgi:hypothetical protein
MALVMDEVTELLDYFVENFPSIWRFWRVVGEKKVWGFSNDRKIPTDLFTKIYQWKEISQIKKKLNLK